MGGSGRPIQGRTPLVSFIIRPTSEKLQVCVVQGRVTFGREPDSSKSKTSPPVEMSLFDWLGT